MYNVKAFVHGYQLTFAIADYNDRSVDVQRR